MAMIECYAYMTQDKKIERQDVAQHFCFTTKSANQQSNNALRICPLIASTLRPATLHSVMILINRTNSPLLPDLVVPLVLWRETQLLLCILQREQSVVGT